MSSVPNPEEPLQAFMQADQDEPVCMVNLLKFRECAAYAAGTPEARENLSGKEAYMRYLAGVTEVFERIGAKFIFSAPAERFLLGSGDWDMVLLAWYPNRRTVLEMGQREDYQAVFYHREAGLSHQDLIETTPGVI